MSEHVEPTVAVEVPVSELAPEDAAAAEAASVASDAAVTAMIAAGEAEAAAANAVIEAERLAERNHAEAIEHHERKLEECLTTMAALQSRVSELEATIAEAATRRDLIPELSTPEEVLPPNPLPPPEDAADAVMPDSPESHGEQPAEPPPKRRKPHRWI